MNRRDLLSFALRRARLVVVFLLAWSPRLQAQDVLVQGAERGIEPPAWVVQVLQQDPDAFEFRHAWLDRARRVREARALLRAQAGPQLSAGQLAAVGAAVTGTYRIPVLPGLYSNVSAPVTQSAIEDRLFGTGSGTVSLTAVYDEMSLGVFTLSGSVSSWLELPNARSYYEPAPGTGDRFGRVWEFLTETLDAADPGIDFGQFDNDGADGIPNSGDDDGFVDTAAFLYASVAKSCGGTATGIWPHRWNYASARYVRGDGVYQAYVTSDPSSSGGFIQVDDYIIQSAVQCDGVSLMGSGTIAHEMGHAVALPDLYDTTGASLGIGVWGLMGAGNWNTQTSPAHMSAWSKDQLGWLSVSTVTVAQPGMTLPAVQSSGMVLRVDLPGTPEYFLLSNRQALGSDQYLPRAGLLVWHIDPNVTTVNNVVTRKLVDLEEADGLDELDAAANAGDAGDSYPGSTAALEFSTLTYPASDAYDGSFCTVGLRNIQESGFDILVDVSPSERYVLWGDIDGTRELDASDLYYSYAVDMGFLGSFPEIQRTVGNGDVDGDTDVDLRDGLILHANLVGGSGPLDSRAGSDAFVACDAGAALALDPWSPTPGLQLQSRLGSIR
jgi:M6 family metalloprotease-like protein